jgi:hypothetical protein
MAKFYSHSTVTVCTFHEDGSPVSGPADEEFLVRSLGRGRWLVKSEDGFHTVMRTAELQRYFRPHVYEDGYHSSGEPVIAYEEVRVERDPWWRW